MDTNDIWTWLENAAIRPLLTRIDKILSYLERLMPKEDAVGDDMIAQLLSAALPAFPYSAEVVQITTVPGVIYRNDTQKIVRIKIQNWDFAQSLLVGGANLTSTVSAFQITAQNDRDMNVDPGQEVYAVVAIAFINISVSRLEDPLTVLKGLT